MGMALLSVFAGASSSLARGRSTAPATAATRGREQITQLARAIGAPDIPIGHGFTKASRPPTSTQCERVVGLACYSPHQLQRAYELGPLYAKGFDGKGRTIVIVDPLGSPTIRHDLKVFDRGFGLPAPPSFRVLEPVGPVPPYNPNDQEAVDKAGETTGDVEAAHALAPGANIVLVETPEPETLTGGGFPQMIKAENDVIKHNVGAVISQSFSLPEQNFPSRSFILGLRYAYRNARRHHVTVLAASNDFGVSGATPTGGLYWYRVVYWPASDPLVTGVGGTKLHLDAAGRRVSPDTAWNDSDNLAVANYFGAEPWAGNGGVSTIFSRPGYQSSVRSIVGSHRGVPDIALSASLSGGVAVYGSYRVGTYPQPFGWAIGGGTSAATPEFAGIVAIADQYAKRRLGFINPALYRMELARAPGIVDVTKGNNTVSFVADGETFTVKGYRARPGYDLATGVGTIDAARFVPELAKQR